MTESNLAKWFARADDIDVAEGIAAYPRYRIVMEVFAERFGYPLDRTVAAFVALSPNTDYLSNLRSLVSVMSGLRDGRDRDKIVVSTYNHNRDRAIRYLTGEAAFVDPSRGLKISAFYDNILKPDSVRVTVDGHVVGVWLDQPVTMKEATVSRRSYREIENEVRRLAFYHHLRSYEMQAILWFTRKRVLGIKFDPQLALFGDNSDRWGVIAQAEGLEPYGVAQ